MNKLLYSMTRLNAAISANEDKRLSTTPNRVNVELNIDIDTWRYFEDLDEDSRTMMARVLKDYVQHQK